MASQARRVKKRFSLPPMIKHPRIFYSDGKIGGRFGEGMRKVCGREHALVEHVPTAVIDP